jgi:hypothetical protein
VRHVGPDGVAVQQLRGGALEGSFAAPGAMRSELPQGEAASFVYDGPGGGKWQVWQGPKLLKQHFADEAAARRWFADHLTTLRRETAQQRRKAAP